ncbi:ABC transporter C family member 12 [Nymphaea thermarum]|nr:ABC transporter C family member 12 [Nymphaea thermarum]
MGFKPLDWYCRPVANGVWTKDLENAFGAYTPCGVDTLVLCISHLAMMGVCIGRVWKLSKDRSLKRYRLRSPYYNYTLSALAAYAAAEPLYRLVMGLSIMNLDGQTSFAPFEVFSLLVEAFSWCCMLAMLVIETKIYICELRWYVRFGVLYVLVGDVVMFNLLVPLRGYVSKWMTPLMQLGYKKPITEKDIWKLDSWDKTEVLYNKFWLGGVFKIGNDASQFVGPIILSSLLEAFEVGAETTRGRVGIRQTRDPSLGVGRVVTVVSEPVQHSDLGSHTRGRVEAETTRGRVGIRQTRDPSAGVGRMFHIMSMKVLFFSLAAAVFHAKILSSATMVQMESGDEVDMKNRLTCNGGTQRIVSSPTVVLEMQDGV